MLNKEKQQRKKYAKDGESRQKMMSFRLDYESRLILEQVANKGRLINDLIKEWGRRHQPIEKQWETDPRENDIEDWQP